MRLRSHSIVLSVAHLALVAALLAPAAAEAHATLEGSSPPRGATLERQPAAVVFRFSEPVEGSFGAVRVYDAEGSGVDRGEAFHPDGRGADLGLELQPGLPEGSYTATYRVVSADGHLVSGGYVFAVGRPGRAPEETVAELVDADSGTLTEIGLGLARGVQYASLAVALGALAFLLLVWRVAARHDAGVAPDWPQAQAAFRNRLRMVLLGAALAGLLSAAAAVVFHAAEAAAVSPGSALDPAILREELGTRFGTVWGLSAVAWILFGLGALVAPRAQRRWAPLALLLPLGFLALEPALSGHPSTQSPVALLFTANVVHVVAASAWAGGLAGLLLVLPAATRRLETTERSRLLAACLARFSPLALPCVAAILLTGLGQSYAYVRDLDNLLDTAYGRAVLIKLVLLAGLLIPLGAYQRYRSLPRLRRIAADGVAPGHAGLTLRRTLRGEVALLLVVFGVTAALAGYPPPTATQSGPFSAGAALGPAELQITVDPAQVGPNQIHLYLFDARSGAQFTAVKELGVEAGLPEKEIGPLDLRPQLSGPGHYTVSGAPLSVAGEWELEVSARVSAFDQYTNRIGVPIR